MKVAVVAEPPSQKRGRTSEADHVDGVIDEDSALEEELLAADGEVEAKEVIAAVIESRKRLRKLPSKKSW